MIGDQMTSRAFHFASPEQVRAALARKLTQHRVPVRPQTPAEVPCGHYFDAYDGGPQWNFWTQDNRLDNSLPIWRSPFGVLGDELWLQETRWRSGDYVATSQPRIKHEGKIQSNHMPRRSSRATFRLTDLRAEMLQEISEEDLREEGMVYTQWPDAPRVGQVGFGDGRKWEIPDRKEDRGWHVYGAQVTSAAQCLATARTAFWNTWDATHKSGEKWADNPVVWVPTFERIS